MMKRCTKCRRLLPLLDFYKDLSRLDGLTYQCKKCCTEYRRARRSKTAEYYQANKVSITKRKRRYCQLHKDKTAKQNRKFSHKYYLSHKIECHTRYQHYCARKRKTTIEKFLDIEISERDGWVCGICGKHVDETLKHPHPRSKSLDHIVPLIAGGEHTRINVQLAHLGCNMSKRAKRNGQLRLVG